MDNIFKAGVIMVSFGMGVLCAFHFAIGMPTEKHVEIETRALNWPEKECYTYSDIEMIVFGPKNWGQELFINGLDKETDVKIKAKQ
tara:strand:+ start:1221 stop:1478 length:258 start_codon:yes stop_codon:yes gene_type:complete